MEAIKVTANGSLVGHPFGGLDRFSANLMDVVVILTWNTAGRLALSIRSFPATNIE